MLRSVIRVGTANAIADFPRPAAGKTGTTEDFVDAWFVGMTPTLTTAVWNGFPTIRVPMLTQFDGEPVFGGTFPRCSGRRSRRPRSRARRSQTGPPAPVAGAEMIDPATGKLAGPNCPRARAVVMAYAKMPTQTSSCTGTVIPTPEVTTSTASEAQRTLDRAGLLPELVQAVPPAGEPAGPRVRAEPAAGRADRARRARSWSRSRSP